MVLIRTAFIHPRSSAIFGDNSQQIPKADDGQQQTSKVSGAQSNILGLDHYLSDNTSSDEEKSGDCPVCLNQGPAQDGGHKCAKCLTPVHAFGCSVPIPEGEEGFGGTDRLCLKCAQAGALKRKHAVHDETPRSSSSVTQRERSKRTKLIPVKYRKSYVFDTPDNL